MKEKIKIQKGFILIPLLIIIIFSITATIGVGYGVVEYKKTSKIIKEAEQLTKEEKYNEAIEQLTLTQDEWLVKNLGIKKQNIANEIEKNKKLLQDKLEYTQGVEEFEKENWEQTKELLLKVSETSSYYQDAKSKIEEAQKKITEKQIAETVEKATEEIKKKTEEAKKATEEAQRKIEEEKVKRIEEETQRKIEEEKTKKKTAELEQQLKKLQQTQQFQPGTGLKVSEIVEGVGRFIVKVHCLNRWRNWTTGSGIIYGLDSKEEQTIILTNYHITEDADLDLKHPCFIAYSLDPIKGFTDFYFVNSVYFPSTMSLSMMKLIDFDFLRIEAKFRLSAYEGFEIIPNASLKIGEYKPVICKDNEIKVGEEIVILGYPSVGGEYLTATDGIISGHEGTYYLTTSAKIEQGSSGGGAFLKSTGCLVGIPTFVRSGRIEALARLINMPYLKQNYLSKIWK